MSEHVHTTEDDSATPWSKHKFVALIIGAIGISIIMVSISLALYASSGTAQLDASRPGFQAVQSQVRKEETFAGFSASGAVDAKTLSEFKKMFDEQSKEATAVDAFAGDGLADDVLGIDDPTINPEQQ